MRESLRTVLVSFFEEYAPESFYVKEISEHFGMNQSQDFKILVKELAALEEEGILELNRNGKFGLNPLNQTLKGTYRANDKGFGFVTVVEGEPDIFIPRGDTMSAMDGDEVELVITEPADSYRQRSATGKIVQIIQRNTTQVVGIYTRFSSETAEDTGYCGEVVVKDKKLAGTRCLIRPNGLHPVDGTVVIVELTKYTNEKNRSSLEGIVVKEIGYKDAVGMDILMVLQQLHIPTEFPQEVIDQANLVPEVITDEDRQGRKDLREQLTVTIDGADAKDLDDAVALTKREDGTFELTVSIADVSYYVTENSAIDREAFERGTSVYLTDRVVPMLPQRLSNGICSLHPHEERLTMSCRMEIDRSGTIYQYEIFPSVIRSDMRLTYNLVNELYEKKEVEIPDEIQQMLLDMKELHHILERRRKERGAIDFETHEAKIIVDEQGAPIDIQIRERGVAERLIESFMLAANETVAIHYQRKNVPFIYRVHEQPQQEKMQRFLEFVTAFGINIKGTSDTISPKKLQKALDEVKGETYEAVVSTMMLRSMKQAKYDITPSGHYGLAAEDYTHFTSPIRRYPDLIVHRMIRQYEGSGSFLSKQQEELNASKLERIADQSSKMERLAVQAEREVDAMKKAEFMADKIGQEFEGIVSSVTKFGMFVELPNTVEGLVHITHMNQDYFNFIESHMVLIGERTGVTYRIGDRVKVKLIKVDVEAHEIDFILSVDNADLITQNKRPTKGKEALKKAAKKESRSNKSKKSSKNKGRQHFKAQAKQKRRKKHS